MQKISRVGDYNWEDKKVLVTGASGFKGAWLCKTLLKLGANVYGVVRKNIDPLSAYYLFNLGNDIVTVDTDISFRQQVFDMLNSVDPDVIFHLAAKAVVSVGMRDPRRTFDVNIMGTINIVEACRTLQVGKRLFIVSTDHVFGSVDEKKLIEGEFKGGFKEIDRVSFGGPYDSSKSAMELCVRSYNYKFRKELPVIGISRATNVYGPGDTAQRRVIPNFIKAADALSNKYEKFDINDSPLRCKKNGRQFIHIMDIVEGYVRGVSKLEERKNDNPETIQTFHFALNNYGRYSTNEEPFIRIEKLAELVGDIFNVKIPEHPSCVDYASGENGVQALNCEYTFNELLNWHPKISLEDGVKKLADWYSKNTYDKIKLMDRDISAIASNLTKVR